MFELKMRDNSALPRFVSFNRALLALVVNNPIVGATPSEVGTFYL
jgi:hypothetical protein